MVLSGCRHKPLTEEKLELPTFFSPILGVGQNIRNSGVCVCVCVCVSTFARVLQTCVFALQ